MQVKPAHREMGGGRNHNMMAGVGRLPDAEMRRRMAKYVDAL